MGRQRRGWNSCRELWIRAGAKEWLLARCLHDTVISLCWHHSYLTSDWRLHGLFSSVRAARRTEPTLHSALIATWRKLTVMFLSACSRHEWIDGEKMSWMMNVNDCYAVVLGRQKLESVCATKHSERRKDGIALNNDERKNDFDWDRHSPVCHIPPSSF